MTGESYYRARYYDSGVGRFLSEDPIGFSGGMDFYAYVANNPINLIDPMGLASDCGNLVPQWLCDWIKGRKPSPPQTCVCTRAITKPFYIGGKVPVCTYMCDCVGTVQQMLFSKLKKLKGCESITDCPYQVLATVDTSGNNNVAIPSPRYAPQIDPPAPQQPAPQTTPK